MAGNFLRDPPRDESSVTDPGRVVFLSYASQDAEAAQKICEALRAAGIEVFLDQSELRGGDAWDQKIRREIRRTDQAPAVAELLPLRAVSGATPGLKEPVRASRSKPVLLAIIAA